MIQTITQHDLVKLLYRETEKENVQFLKDEILCDEGFAESYYQLRDTKDQLDEMCLTPSTNWAQNVLAYAKKKA